MPSRVPTPPWVAAALLLSALPSSIQGEAITDNLVTPLGGKASLTHHHPAFGGFMRGTPVKPVALTEQNGDTARNLEAALSDLERLETHYGAIETNFNVLKDSYPSAVCDVPPWSGDYWPTYKDGVNFVWKEGEPSPAEKYATAFGLDVNTFMDGVSISTGVLSESYSYGSACSSDADCSSLGDGSLCGIRDGKSSGYCIPTWYGICHAWAAAAILETEPMCDVVKDNVTFHPVDVKALLSQLYDGAAIEVVFFGVRFNGPDSPEEVDTYGRYEDEARRDVSAAFFHIAAANILGKQHQSFIVDASSGSQVWNQPVQMYEFLEAEIVDTAELSLKYFGTETYPFNDAVTYLAKCTTRLTWTAESLEDGALTTTGRIEAYTVYDDYEYCLELDENYTIIGGEWLGSSREDHPDFMWFPAGKPSADTVTDTGMLYADVLELLEQSQQCDVASLTISPEAQGSSSTKTPGSSSTKTPGKTKSPTTKTPVTKTPATTAPATYTPETTAPSTYYPETTAPSTYYPETTAPATYTPETTAPSTYSPNTTAPATYTPKTPTPTPTTTKKTTSPAQQSTSQSSKKGSKWYRRLGEFILW